MSKSKYSTSFQWKMTRKKQRKKVVFSFIQIPFGHALKRR